MTAYVVGAERVVERPWPSGPSDTEIETREVPEGMVHAVDPETGQALCGSRDRLVILNTPWQETWRLSYVDSPDRCRRCVVLAMDTGTQQKMIAQFERFEREGDERQRLFARDILRHLRDELGEEA